MQKEHDIISGPDSMMPYFFSSIPGWWDCSGVHLQSHNTVWGGFWSKTSLKGDSRISDFNAWHLSPLSFQMDGGMTNEMCLAFLFYYPASQITSCIIYPNTTHPMMNSSYQYEQMQCFIQACYTLLYMFSHKRLLVSDRMNTTMYQSESTEYESWMKMVPELQVISNDEVSNRLFLFWLPTNKDIQFNHLFYLFNFLNHSSANTPLVLCL